MKPKIIQSVLVALGFLFLQTSVLAQHEYTFEVKALRAKIIDTTFKKDVIVIFYISAVDSLDFPPVLHLPPVCSIQVNGKDENLIFSPENIAISLDGDKLILTNMLVYDIIKGMVDFTEKKNMMILSFRMKDVSAEKFDKMSVTLSLGEKRNPDKKFAKNFVFKVDPF
ncbi:MAG: hypothetical protein PSX36_13005 [bacterium]|nr:hypothetical protein [bacterium]